MDRAGDKLLPRPALAANEDRGAGAGCLSDKLVHFDHARIATDKPVDLAAPPVRLRWPGVAARAAILEHPVDHAAELAEIERLDEEFHRPAPHRRDHCRHVVERGH